MKKDKRMFQKSRYWHQLIGFFEKRGNTFKNIIQFFHLFSQTFKEHNIKHFIHLSALGISEAKDLNMQKQTCGEQEI